MAQLKRMVSGGMRFRAWQAVCRGIFLWALLRASSDSAGAAPAGPAPEYQVKAVFLFNFSQFVQWPASMFSAPDSPLIIGILGEDPFGPYLDDIVRGESVEGHPLIVRRYTTVDSLEACHILFISQTERSRTSQLLGQLTHHSILTVADFEGFTAEGGMIRFVTEKQKIRLRINVGSVKSAGLSISSKLLRLAEIIGSGED